MTDDFERRVAPRAIAMDSRCTIGWRSFETFLSFPARLIDVSRAGAGLESAYAPPLDREDWLRLHRMEEDDQICGEVVGLKPRKSGDWSIRIAFWAPCPERLYRAAVDGPIVPPADTPTPTRT